MHFKYELRPSIMGFGQTLTLKTLLNHCAKHFVVFASYTQEPLKKCETSKFTFFVERLFTQQRDADQWRTSAIDILHHPG